MSTVTVSSMESRSSGATSFSQGLTVGGVDIKTLVAVTEYHTGGTQPSSAANGAIWWDGTDVQQYINAEWIILSGSFPTPVPAMYGSRGVFGGGNGRSNVMDYITIASTGNATDFGDLSAAKDLLGACSSGSRGLFGGGSTGSTINVIDYITVANTGNATDFGNLTSSRFGLSACSSVLRGLFGGGGSNTVDYVTIASTGNATDFGNLSVSTTYNAACSNATRALFAGGNS